MSYFSSESLIKNLKSWLAGDYSNKKGFFIDIWETDEHGTPFPIAEIDVNTDYEREEAHFSDPKNIFFTVSIPDSISADELWEIFQSRSIKECVEYWEANGSPSDWVISVNDRSSKDGLNYVIADIKMI